MCKCIVCSHRDNEICLKGLWSREEDICIIDPQDFKVFLSEDRSCAYFSRKQPKETEND